MKTLRPVSAQRVRSALNMQHLSSAEMPAGVWTAHLRNYVVTWSLKNSAILHVKGQSNRRFRGTAALRGLMNYVNASNRNRVLPKAYLELAEEPTGYTVSAEVDRIISRGMNELQFSAFSETATLALSTFFGDFELAIKRGLAGGSDE